MLSQAVRFKVYFNSNHIVYVSACHSILARIIDKNSIVQKKTAINQNNNFFFFGLTKINIISKNYNLVFIAITFMLSRNISIAFQSIWFILD